MATPRTLVHSIGFIQVGQRLLGLNRPPTSSIHRTGVAFSSGDGVSVTQAKKTLTELRALAHPRNSMSVPTNTRYEASSLAYGLRIRIQLAESGRAAKRKVANPRKRPNPSRDEYVLRAKYPGERWRTIGRFDSSADAQRSRREFRDHSPKMMTDVTVVPSGGRVPNPTKRAKPRKRSKR